MPSSKLSCKFSAASIRAHILVPYCNVNEQAEYVLRKSEGKMGDYYNLDPRVRFSFGHRGQSC